MSADFAADQEGGLMNGKGNQLSQLSQLKAIQFQARYFNDTKHA